MKRFVVCVRDSAMASFATPVCVPTIAMAHRSFADEVNNPQEGNALHKHPEDYELHCVAVFDEETGKFTNNEDQTLVVRGKDVKQAA